MSHPCIQQPTNMNKEKSRCSLHKVGVESASVLLNMMQEFYAIDNYSFEREQAIAALNEFIKHPDLGCSWLIQKDNTFIGYAILCVGFTFEFGGRDAFIDELFIEKPYRNKGYGRQVMDLIEEYAKSLNLVALHLEVEEHNTNGLALYRRMGFKGKQSRLLSKSLRH